MILGKTYTILLVDDDPHVLEMLEDIFRDHYLTLKATSGAEAIEIVRRHDEIATVVMDIKMPDMDGLTAARNIKSIKPDIPVIFHTGYPGDYDEDIIDRQEKPFDYILKGEPIAKLTRSVRNAVESYHLKKDNELLTRHAESNFDLIGNTTAMREVYRLINKVAPSDRKVMLTGETGTGKELVAKAIHNHSRRKDMKFAAFNCDPRSSDLMKSELFGHVKGAFTGASADKVGLFDYANGGTIFLDEVGDLDNMTQVELLRVLENGEYRAVGSPVIKNTDVRLICATNKDLVGLVKSGNFREDLYFRLKGIQIHMPPLRERKEDIPLLVEKFKDHFTIEKGLTPKQFDPTAMSAFIKYDWPGNVRELLEAVESIIVLADSDIILGDEVCAYLKADAENIDAGNNSDQTLAARVEQFTREVIIEALAKCNNNIAASARLLGMDRANLCKKIKKLNIDRG